MRNRHTQKSRRPAAAFLVGGLALTIAVGGGLVSREVIRVQERKLLERASFNAASLLHSAFVGAQSSLRSLHSPTGVPSQERLDDFAQRPGPLGGKTVAVTTVFEGPDGFIVGPDSVDGREGDTSIDIPRRTLVRRALRTGELVAGVVEHDSGSRLVLAVSGSRKSRRVTLHESEINPRVPIPRGAGSPFSDLRGAVFISTDNSSLLLTSEASLPMTGAIRTETRVGATTFVLVTKARAPLVGTFAARFPLLVSLVAILAGVFVTAMTAVLGRRRYYTLRLVAERTTALTASLAELTAARGALERMVTGGPMVVVKRDLLLSKVTYVSPNVERILGHAAATAAHENFVYSYAHPDDFYLFAEAVAHVEAHGSGSRTIEMRLRGGGDEYRWISLQLWPDEVVDGRVISMVTYALDVDDRRKAEDARREAQLLAEAANDVKSKFLSHVSHELRTPLHAILGFGQLLEEDVTNPEQGESVDQIMEAANHLLSLVNELLDFTSVERAHDRRAIELTDPIPIILECAELLAAEAERMHVVIACAVSGLTAPEQLVCADAFRVKQILLNLLSNAIKYNRKGGTVTVTTRILPNERFAISVADTGRGIAPSDLAHLFTPFDRLGAENSDVGGIGLGLALSRQLAREMSGDVSVVSTPGEGSAFALVLPCAVSSPVPPNAAPANQVLSVEPPRHDALEAEPAFVVEERSEVELPDLTPAKGQLLLAEDDPINRRMTLAKLKGSGFRVDVVTNGVDAVRAVRTRHYDAVLMDCQMPRLTGWDATTAIRATEDPGRRLPIIALTVGTRDEDRNRALRCGMDDYLAKPVLTSDLLDTLARWTSQSGARAAAGV